MTDRELVIALAEKVMGWHTHAISERMWFTGTNSIPKGNWNPLESISDAWMIVERIREIVPKQTTTQTYAFQLCQTGIPGEWTASFTVNDFDWSHQATAEADTAPRAICLAGIKALGVSVRELCNCRRNSTAGNKGRS